MDGPALTGVTGLTGTHVAFYEQPIELSQHPVFVPGAVHIFWGRLKPRRTVTWSPSGRLKKESDNSRVDDLMATPTQYAFNLNEVATALIKQQNIHTGKWWVVFDFMLGAGVFGVPSGARRGALARRPIPERVRSDPKNYIGASREPPPPAALVVDAAEVNPESN